MDKALLEKILKSGITVQGDLVMEKHVENEIGNVEAGGIGIQIVHSMADKSTPCKPSRPAQHARGRGAVATCPRRGGG